MPAIEFTATKLPVPRRGRMFSPRNITSERAWFKAARKVIPEIPDPEKTDWQITSTQIDTRWIRYTLHNSVGESATVLIDRQVPGLG